MFSKRSTQSTVAYWGNFGWKQRQADPRDSGLLLGRQLGSVLPSFLVTSLEIKTLYLIKSHKMDKDDLSCPQFPGKMVCSNS